VKLRELIEAKLTEMSNRYLVDVNGNYIVGLESARIFVMPAWIPNGPTIVRIFAITNLDVPVTIELAAYLLGKNLEFILGGFALDADNGAVWLAHNLLGDSLTPEELEAAVAAIASSADVEDDEIKRRFGGRLYVESPDESVSPPPTPGYL
jgi:hypothetical protein